MSYASLLSFFNKFSFIFRTFVFAVLDMFVLLVFCEELAQQTKPIQERDERAGQHRTRQGRAMQGETRQDRGGQGMTGAGQGKTGQDMTGR